MYLNSTDLGTPLDTSVVCEACGNQLPRRRAYSGAGLRGWLRCAWRGRRFVYRARSLPACPPPSPDTPGSYGAYRPYLDTPGMKMEISLFTLSIKTS